jgi:hypothetical protein
MYANSVLAAFGVAGQLILTPPAISAPLAGSIIEDAIEDERLQYCDALEDKCEDGKEWACRAVEREPRLIVAFAALAGPTFQLLGSLS